ncbi:hypothetical protein Slala03_78270 [Streptomyces lavendulae subsp. lavendulae]|nr:hypothetical protein Slala03_78270 [Streptomyces lavendulae subsp. lavendulae]
MGGEYLGNIAGVPVRPARRPRPAAVAFMAGVLLLCAFLMAGPAHPDGAMPMAGGMSSMPTAASGSDVQQLAAWFPAGGGCPAMAMDCPLASAQSPLPVTLVAPTPALAEQVVLPGRSASAAAMDCARPRAPDPVALLCVSRT